MPPTANRPQSFPALSLPHGRELALRSTLIMGIVNVTPDSFSDGGHYVQADLAVAHGLAMVRDGAAILDVGGESSRPGAATVPAADEMARVLPVIRELKRQTHVPISIDTTKADVAAAAIEAGASIVNDVWGFQGDPGIADVVAGTGAAVVLMHNRGHDGIDPSIDIVADVLRFLTRSIEIAARAGVGRDQVIVDPGFGFGKTDAQNLVVIRELRQFAVLGCPILLGVSRKSSIGRLGGEPNAIARLPGSLAAALYGARNGALILRVHDVAAHTQALRVVAALEETAVPAA